MVISLNNRIFARNIKEMDHPLVSIIIPNYNHARFLNQRIHSVLDQTYKNFEIIILDDKSSDNSMDIIYSYHDNPKVSYIIRNEENSGSPFIQWKKGIDLAKGELVWIAESDDSCENNLLECLIPAFETDDSCVISFCKSIKINFDGRQIGIEGLSSQLHIKGNLFIKKYLCRHNYITNASSVIFRKDVIKDIDWSFMNYRGCGDWVLWIEICRHGNIAYYDYPLNYFRIHGANTTLQQAFDGRNEIEGAKVYKYMLQKKYISYKDGLRARISHIYSVSYGKQSSFYSDNTKNELLQAWKVTPFIRIITWIIYIIQKNTNYIIIKR